MLRGLSGRWTRQVAVTTMSTIFCLSVLSQVFYHFPTSLFARDANQTPSLNVNEFQLGQEGRTSTQHIQPTRRALLHAEHHSIESHSHGVKLELQRIESPCGLQKFRDDGFRDHQRLRCAVHRSLFRAQEVRKKPRIHDNTGSKAGGSPTGSTTAVGFTAPVAAARGEYLATVRLGTPERVFSVIVDTGSDLTWVQCSPCGKCYSQNDALFLPNTSTSFTKLACGSALCNGLPFPMCNQTTCVYWYSYGDGSLTTGDFVYDTITMDGINGQKQQVPNFAFGCGHDNEGSFAGADGILGLGQGPLSFHSQLKSVYNGKFSYCLVDWLAPPTQTSPLLFGDAAVPILPDVKYLPILANPKVPTYYYVKLNGISVGDNLLNISSTVFDIDSVGGAGTIFDSGTTVTQLAEAAYKEVLAAMNASTMAYSRKIDDISRLDLCLSGFPKDQLPTVPAMTFHFEGGDMVLPPSNYFIYLESSQSYCFAMTSSPDVNIIGSVQQQNFQVYYDTAGRKLGFVPKDCVGRR
ncbi:aspartyl protease family protein 2 isoform X2 [Physcomitrium patens]|nr:aspartyl protease family protein 2-like isoform X2 [Physcomitrium patens]XP_024391842.1 aspartyl protease family protein 2-like isoform X2 [Physcomitrium patens]XP_024391844.1 aspartyl protease family protein 2-like isoform X2 [Physcomitrium patens]XP_024391845.1 aspartyl protease family protein 2-like isoform X2 [Physcomitrium patens]XP_024391846.1 aspartyl protease family protein 2-like isoform X2 [Physcomitrium patens]XP_024391847.1 aspartyl protease family protein 2-like isoform X2 [Phy|eukprot:XP_024391841.1 aspartyl protease family protein 2-like isoform X2 [Physcomitrella patens]